MRRGVFPQSTPAVPTACPSCGASVEPGAAACPVCGAAVRPRAVQGRRAWGFEWRSPAEIFGIPLVHVAVGRDARTGRLRVARGIIAVGQFGFGVVTIAQFGVGLLFGIGQCVAGFAAAGQVALGAYFGIGQVATGWTAIGQIAFGTYVLAQVGIGTHVWSPAVKDPVALHHFHRLWETVRGLFGRGG